MELSYPIGKFDWKQTLTPEIRAESIRQIAATPGALREAVAGLDETQLDTPYRPGGWTVRQVIHHMADSHMNSYIRCRLALTEETPTIKPYMEAKWAELHDARTAPVADSLQLLEAMHERWVNLLSSLEEADFSRVFNHPANGPMSLNTTVALYAWHGRHHAAHITALRERMGWK